MVVLFLIWFIFTCSYVHSLNKTCFDNICYEFNNSKVNYSVASDLCKQRNLTLAFIYNLTAQSVLTDYINSSSDSFYIGLRYIHNERFIWDCNSDQVPNLAWDTGNIKINSSESCAYLKDNVTNVGPCQEPRRFICSNASHPMPQVDPTSHSAGRCPQGFFRFLNKCYSMNLKCSDESRNWTTAQRYCQSLRSDSHLVIIDSLIEQEFVTALMTRSPHAFWTGLVHAQVAGVFSIWIDARSAAASSVQRRLPRYGINFKIHEPNNVAHEHCLMVYHRLSDIGKINDENCSIAMNHLCEASLVPDSTGAVEQPSPLLYRGRCLENYFEFNETCFLVDKLLIKYEETRHFCKQNVLFLHGHIDVAFVRSLMAHKNVSDVWISVFDKTKDGKDVLNSGAIWLLNETGDAKKMNLEPNSNYYLSSRQRGLQKAKSIEESHSSICYYFLEDHERNTNDLLCPLHWVKVGTKCFQTEIQHIDFTRSNTQCKIFNGKLATLKNMKEVQAVSAMVKFDSWIGLTGESYLNDTWMDGTGMDYCLFRHDKNQTNIIKANPKSYCFILRNSKSEWVARNCKDLNVFICEQPAEKNRCPPSLPINMDGDCYGAFNDSMTWDDAEKFCSGLESPKTHLVSFHSMSQELTLLDEINSSKYYWMGMRFYEGTMRWVDRTPLNYQRNYWIFATDYSRSRSCVTTAKPSDQRNFWWRNENCGLKKPFICKMTRKNFVSPVETKKTSGYYCPKGFTKHGTYCYKFFNESLKWVDADKSCEALFKYPNPVARLARFDRLNQFESVLSSLGEHNDIFVWIGLYQEKETSEYVWVDEKPFELVKFVHYSNNSWNLGDKVAVEISKNPYRNGRWWKREEAQYLPFLCRVDPHQSYDMVRDNFLNEMYNKLMNEVNCPPSFMAHNGQCYYYNSAKLQFNDARAACQKLDATLLVINDSFEENFIKSIMRDRNEIYIWMGFEVHANSAMTSWKTVDNLPVYYTHWDQLEGYSYPDESLQNKIVGCYVLKLSEDSNSVNGMSQISCLNTVNSICKVPIKEATKRSDPIKCATSLNGTSYDIDVVHSKTGAACVRWDLVRLKEPYSYHTDTRLVSSLPFNDDGYLSYSLQRCSESTSYDNHSRIHGYSCYTVKDNRFYLEDCEMVRCGTTPVESGAIEHHQLHNAGHPFLILISVITIIFGLAFLVFVFRGRWLANYRVREFLARVLGRYQPDCLRYPTQSRSQMGAGVGSVGGTGFVNPVYTPLESRY